MSSVAVQQYNAPFDAVANVYDNDFENNIVTQHLRSLIWKESLNRFKPGQHILELNCGTGTDAIFFAKQGINVTALDASSEMITVAKSKVLQTSFDPSSLNFLHLKNESLNQLQGNLYDGIFSNFGGLNCTPDLNSVIQSWLPLLKPNSYIVLCFLNKIYPWEIFSQLFRGRIRQAFRRFSNQGTVAQLGKSSIRVWYYTPAEISQILSPQYTIENIFGINIVSPNPTSQRFISHNVELTKSLLSVDDVIQSSPLFYGLGDHFIVTARLK